MCAMNIVIAQRWFGACADDFVNGHTARGPDWSRDQGVSGEMAACRMTVPVFDDSPDTTGR